MTAPLRVGVIGTGGIAKAHVEGYQLAGAEVVALCDVNPVTLDARQTEWKVATGYTQYQELLNDPTIEAVSICTPNSSHHPITMAAAAAGKHVLCEKPVSMDLAQAEEMINMCEKAGVVFQVGHHMRSWAAAVQAKGMIDHGHIGEITYARFRQAHDWGGAKEVRGVFGSKEASGGGTLLDNGCHLFDLARFFGGNVGDVFARISTRKFEIEEKTRPSRRSDSSRVRWARLKWRGPVRVGRKHFGFSAPKVQWNATTGWAPISSHTDIVAPTGPIGLIPMLPPTTSRALPPTPNT